MYLSDSFPRRGWDPFREMERVLADMDQFVARTRSGELAEEAAANVWANDDQVVITLVAPGLDAQATEVTAVGETVTVRGKARAAETGEGEWLRREREAADFTRTFQLPFAVDADRAQAQYRNGILALRLQRPEADKPRRIAVAAS